MGAMSFVIERNGKSAEQCFKDAREGALYDHGHGGYSGTIAEKNAYTMLPLIDGKNAIDSAWQYIDDCDPRVDDKWGPAGCIKTDDGFVFFGWASA